MLINCVAYKDGAKLAECSIDDTSEYLAQPGCFVWVAPKDATAEELSKMQEEFGLHELAIEDSRHGHQRPKIEECDVTLFAVQHTVELGPTDDLTIGEFDIFVGKDFALSVRNRTSTATFRSSMRSRPTSRRSRSRSSSRTSAARTSSSSMSRSAASASSSTPSRLCSRRLPCSSLVACRVPQVCSDNREYLRDVYDHLARMNASLGSLRDTIGIAMQVNLSMVTIEETDITKRLAARAGIIAVACVFM